jgi:hypothetical protein
MQMRKFNPKEGQAFQGDIAIVPMPASIAIATTDEIKPRDGRLIIQEGEVSGHHHAIALPRVRNFRPETRQLGDPAVATPDRKLGRLFGGKGNAANKQTIGSARLYRDAAAVEALRRAGILTRTDLAIGCLVVEGEPAIVSHEEHDAIALPPGNYYVGRQIESAGAEERVVAD